jgi:glycosyltransferase involved in cell wall biosynthesis
VPLNDVKRKKMKPFFSILVPVYNHEKFVGMALDSLLAQTDPDWEACVIDDGSTDGTSVILDDYARRDSRIRVFHKSNGGEASALNAAWREANGLWINWLSSDDLFLPHKLETQRAWIKRHPSCSYFFTDFQTLDDSTGKLQPGYATHTPTPGHELIELLATNYINGISMCVHRQVFESVGAFDEVSRHGQDYDFHLRAVSRYAPIRIPEVTCVQRVHPGQLSQQHTQAMLYDCAAAAIRFLNTCEPKAIMGPTADIEVVAESRKLEEALTVAASPTSFINLIGPHPALVMRLVEWVAEAINNDPGNRSLLDVMGRKARAIAWTQAESPGVGLWQALSVMCDFVLLPASQGFIRVDEVIDTAWYHATATGDERTDLLADYVAKRQKRQMTLTMQGLTIPLPSCVWIVDTGHDVLATSGTVRVADALVECGVSVVVLRSGLPSWTWHRGKVTMTVTSLGRSMMALAATPGDPLVILLPEQRRAWWWHHVWRVIEVDPEKIEALKQAIALNASEGQGKRWFATVISCVGRGLRQWRQLLIKR